MEKQQKERLRHISCSLVRVIHMYVTLFTHPAGFAGRLDRDDNLGVSLSAVLSAVEGCHPEGVNPLTLRIQRLCVLNVT